MNTFLNRNGELVLAILAIVIAFVGAAAHVAQPIEQSAAHAR